MTASPLPAQTARSAAPALLAGLVLGAALATGGCSVAHDSSPAHTATRPVPGTEDARCSGDSHFELSPDDRWLLYESRRGNVFEPLFVVVDLATEARHETALSPETAELAREGRGPALPACWTDDGTIVLTGQRSGFVLDSGRGDFTLRPVDEPPCPPPAPSGRGEADTSATTAARVVRVSPTEVRIEAAAGGEGGTVLARHAAGGGSDRLEIRWLTASPDDRWLAYAVTESRGSFVSPSRAYAVPLPPASGEPIPLVTPVFGPFRWTSEGELFTCTGRPDAPASTGGGPRIVRWAPEP